MAGKSFRFVWFLCVKLTPKSNWWPPLSLLLMAMKQLQRNPFEDLTKPTSFYKTLLYNLQGLRFDSRENWQQSGGFLYPKCPVNISYGKWEIFWEHHAIMFSRKVSYHQPPADSVFCKYWLIRARCHVRYVGLQKNMRNNLRLELHWSLAIPCVVIAVHVPFQGVLKLVKSLVPFCSHRHPAASG